MILGLVFFRDLNWYGSSFTGLVPSRRDENRPEIKHGLRSLAAQMSGERDEISSTVYYWVASRNGVFSIGQRPAV